MRGKEKKRKRVKERRSRHAGRLALCAARLGSRLGSRLGRWLGRRGEQVRSLWRAHGRAVRRVCLQTVLFLLLCGLLGGGLVLTVSECMVAVTRPQVYMTPDEFISPEEGYDCILVLGAGVRADGTPSPMLEDRIKIACALYERTGVPLLMSGDHTGDYNEVGVMKSVAVAAGVPSEDVFLDHEGYSTYESLYRAKEKFSARRVVIVSQGYHLYRALFIARELGLEAVGVPADLRDYYIQTRYEVREKLARFKDLFIAARGEPPCVIDEPMDLRGDGNNT